MTGTPHTRLRVMAAPRAGGGKLVSVFTDAEGDLQARAAAAGSPLSVFLAAHDLSGLTLRVYTPTREKGESDTGALAALSLLGKRGKLLDVADVQMNGETTPAQLCGGEWLLKQGDVGVQELGSAVEELAAQGLIQGLDLDSMGTVHTARISRPTLAVEVSSLETLQAATPDPQAVEALGRATDTTGLLLYVLGGVPELGHAAVSFRAFGPLRGFTEDAASSNMFACLVGVLGARGLLPDATNLLRGLQLRPGQPARLTAQFEAVPGGAASLWVGGSVMPDVVPEP